MQGFFPNVAQTRLIWTLCRQIFGNLLLMDTWFFSSGINKVFIYLFIQYISCSLISKPFVSMLFENWETAKAFMKELQSGSRYPPLPLNITVWVIRSIWVLYTVKALGLQVRSMHGAVPQCVALNLWKCLTHSHCLQLTLR